METTTFENDITVVYVEAKSFPDGVEAAHQALHKKIAYSADRKYFGFSRPENGVINYKAAAEQWTSDKDENLGFETLVLKKGNYITITLQDYMKDIPGIGAAFQKLLQHPGIDPQGYCVEWYITEKDVKCMIRLEE